MFESHSSHTLLLPGPALVPGVECPVCCRQPLPSGGLALCPSPLVRDFPTKARVEGTVATGSELYTISRAPHLPARIRREARRTHDMGTSTGTDRRWPRAQTATLVPARLRSVLRGSGFTAALRETPCDALRFPDEGPRPGARGGNPGGRGGPAATRALGPPPARSVHYHGSLHEHRQSSRGPRSSRSPTCRAPLARRTPAGPRHARTHARTRSVCFQFCLEAEVFSASFLPFI